MRATLSWFPVMLGALALAACGGEKGDGDDDEAPPVTGDTEEDTEEGTETGDTGFSEPLDVIAIGFEYIGGWNQEARALEAILFTEDGTEWTPAYVVVTLASAEYFQGESDVPDEYCEFIAFFDYLPSDSLEGEAFNWETGVGGSGVALESWDMYEGTLVIIPDTMTERCEELDPELWPGGDPLSYMDGMRFGMGFGPLSPYLAGVLEEAYGPDDWATYQDALVTQFIAINHSDGDGGVVFPAYDWNSSLLVDTDYDVCAEAIYGCGYVYGEVCGLPQVDDDESYYLPADSTVQPIRAFSIGNASWLEDIPPLDITLLKEDAI